MQDRIRTSTLPFPFNELPPAEQPICELDLVEIFKPMLDASFALARVTHAATLGKEVDQHDVTQALSVLADYLECSVTFFERWEHRAFPSQRPKGGAA